jgi:hypothetical protein
MPYIHGSADVQQIHVGHYDYHAHTRFKGHLIRKMCMFWKILAIHKEHVNMFSFMAVIFFIQTSITFVVQKCQTKLIMSEASSH